MAVTTLERALPQELPLELLGPPLGEAFESPSVPLPMPVLPARRFSPRPDVHAEPLAEVIQLRRALPPAQDAKARVRLTRRGRLSLTLAGVAGCIAVAALAHGPAQAASPRPGTGSADSVVVAPGDTVWDIAVRADPQGDPRVTMERIVKTNKLSGGRIHPGQRLAIPAN
ncbi:MAG: LysM peptidoglycan-binding domain-containing protein [Mycobacteriales bacterium]